MKKKDTDKTAQPLLSPEFVKKFYDVVAACNRCGFCTSYCPTYNATGDEGKSPRGRSQTFRALIEGRLADPLQASEIVDTCLLCGECSSICFSEVPVAQLMVFARSHLNELSGIPKPLDFFFKKILFRRVVFYWFVKIAFIGKYFGLSKLLRNTGLLKKISPPLAAADELVDEVPLKFLVDYKGVKSHLESAYEKADHRTLVAELKIEQLRKRSDTIPEGLMKEAGLVKRPKAAYLTTCGSQYILPRIGMSTLKLCKKLNVDFVIPNLVCCGLPAASYGVLDQVKEAAKENIRQLERANYDVFIVDDSSCGSHFKDYPKYFQDERDWQARAQALSQKIREVSSFLLQRGLVAHLRKVTWTGGPIAYHDPCKAQYGQKITQPPRELLSSINRLEIVPVADADQCCGGGGTYSFVHPDLSREILSRKIKNIGSSGCKILVTSSSSCQIQLAYGLRQAYPQIEVLHLSEFLFRAIKKQR